MRSLKKQRKSTSELVSSLQIAGHPPPDLDCQDAEEWFTKFMGPDKKLPPKGGKARKDAWEEATKKYERALEFCPDL
jgi:hypothetical protein